MNEIDISAVIRPDVSIVTNSGEPCKVAGITSTGPLLWRVTYVIPAPPITDSVHITAQTLGKKVITIPCTRMLALGTRVVRGPQWDCGDRDGGPGGVGFVKGFYSKDVMYVQWQKERTAHCFKPSCFRIKVAL